MSEHRLNGVEIQDDYSETFRAQMVRLLVTSVNRKWAYEAAMELKGLGRSATAPPCEATLEREFAPEETPDGRPGFAIQLMDRKAEHLRNCLALRIRKGAMPYPKVNVFDALPADLAEDSIDLAGTVIQKFGDGFEQEVEAFGRAAFRLPKMDGWTFVERRFGIREAVTGGMYLILAESDEAALAAAEGSLAAVAHVPLVVVKFASSGSKVGAKHHTDMVATVNHRYCPELPRTDESAVPDGVRCIYEVIVSGPTAAAVRQGMRVGLEAASRVPGVTAIHTANYGGKLGKGKIWLKELLGE